MLGVWEGDQHC